MGFDRMLLWLSAKGHGSWSQFRGAVETFDVDPSLEEESAFDAASDLPVYQEVRFTLQRLGHVEFSSRESEYSWQIVPPTLVIPKETGAEGFLCGARTPVLLDRIALARDLVLERHELAGMPVRIIVRSESHDQLVTRAGEVGLFVQKDAPPWLLSVLPSVRDRGMWRSAKMPGNPGWVVHRFLVYPEPHWREVSQPEARRSESGLYRFVMKHQRFYYLRWRGQTFNVQVQLGKYAVAGRKRGLLGYDASRRTFSVPAVFRPPLLLERALVLCSGVLPRYDATARRLEYSQVEANVAQLAAELLHQEIG